MQKQIDLEPHNYARHQREKGQPVFSPGGKKALLLMVGLAIAAGVSYAVLFPLVRLGVRSITGL
jgi:hypothetical protein